MQMIGMRALLLAFLLVGVQQAAAQTLADVQAAERKLDDVWLKTPLTFRKTLLADKVSGFGVYTERAGNVYAPGDSVLVYSEPVGYGWQDNGDGTYAFGFNVDLLIKSPDGSILGGKENFQKITLTSRARNHEFLLTLRLTPDGFPVGDYILQYTIHDIVTGKTATITEPFSIKKP